MKFFYLLSLGFILALYLFLCPQFIQGGDSSELVSASYHLFVPHPPGYPLYVWPMHGWTHLFSFKSIFWRASVLSVLFSFTALILITLPLRKSWWGVALVLLLGLKEEFLEAGVLPDVFGLHALMISLWSWVYLNVESKKRFFYLPVIFFLSLGNHHTTIFLLPLLLFSFWSANLEEKKLFLKSSLLGLLIFSGLYLSLFLCAPDHPYSWGNLTTLQDLFAHVLRKDYGTLKLMASNKTPDGSAWLFQLSSLFPHLLLFLFCLGYFRREKKFVLKEKFFLGVIILSLFFPLMMNVSAEFMGEEVLKRFHVMPLVLVLSFTAYLLKCSLDKKPFSSFVNWGLGGVMILALGFEARKIFPMLNLRTDAVIEDHAQNLIRVSDKIKPLVIVSDNDSSFFTLRYLLSFEPKKDVVVLAPSLFFHPWYLEKIQKELPVFQLSHEEEVFLHQNFNFKDQVVLPNLDKMNFLMTRNFKEGDSYKVTFLPLGRLVQKGSGVFFGDSPLKFQKIEFPSPPQLHTKSYLYWQYSFYHIAQANEEELKNNPGEVQKHLLGALGIVPYAKHALLKFCQKQEESVKICGPKNIQDVLFKARYLK